MTRVVYTVYTMDPDGVPLYPSCTSGNEFIMKPDRNLAPGWKSKASAKNVADLMTKKHGAKWYVEKVVKAPGVTIQPSTP